MELVQTPAGSFATEAGYDNSKNQAKSEILHAITLSKSFYMGAFEVTQSQYVKVVRKTASHFQTVYVQGQEKAKDSVEPEGLVIQENQQRCKILRGDGANNVERMRSGARASEVPSRQDAPKSFRLAITLTHSPIEVLKKTD